MKNGPIAVLDIGSSKVVCFIAHADSSGKLTITGIGHQLSEGIRAGIVIDIKQAETSILSAVHAAEKMAGEHIEHVVVNITGGSVKSHMLNVETSISGTEVTERDVNHIIRQGYDYFNHDDPEIIHCIPIDYTIDDSRGIKDPRGMCGESLSTELHVVTVSSTAIRNIANCLGRCRLNITDWVVSSYASGLACLTEDEKNLGVILIDIGGGNTSIGMFSEGNIIYADSIALGGGHVTRDIAKGLSTSIAFAERLKALYGSVVMAHGDENEVIDVPASDGFDEDEELPQQHAAYISKGLLTSIIKPRMEEILEMVIKNLNSSGMSKVTAPRVVITGGASQLQGLKELATHMFNRHVRIGKPKQIEGLAESTSGPAFSNAVGMLEYAASRKSENSGTVLEDAQNLTKKGAFGRLSKWFQANF